MKKMTYSYLAIGLAAILALPVAPVEAQVLTASPCGAILCLEGSPVLQGLGGAACQTLTSGFFGINIYGKHGALNGGATIAQRRAYLMSGTAATCVADAWTIDPIIARCGTAPSYSACGGR